MEQQLDKIGIYLNKRQANINQAIALVRIQDNNSFNPIYLKEIIKSSVGQFNLNRLKRPVARANINLEEISTMQLPIPQINKQTEIADYISELRNKAKQLQEEAKEILNQAKATIENMILT
ncbi:MAG: restriction endonuclease subunit S [Saprospiraceae bacterium]